MMPIAFPETRSEFGVLVLGAMAVIVAHGVLRAQMQHRRRLREGYPRRAPFFTRLRRALRSHRS